MSKVRIITDSTSCLPEEVMKEYDIQIVPVGLSINGKAYKDGIDISPNEFWKLFKEAKEMPTTSTPSPGDFAATFSELAKITNDIVCILVSKGLSATNEASVQAREMVKTTCPNPNIEIINSKTSTGALGFIALEAARAAKAGRSLAEVIQVTQEMIPKVKFITAMNTMRYLIKTGRAPKAAYVGEVFQVKPIIGMVSGTGLVESLGRVNGKKKAIVRLAEMMEEYIDVKEPVYLMVHYTDSIEAGEELKDLVTSRLNCKEIYFTPYSSVMASATGPVVAVAFYSG